VVKDDPARKRSGSKRPPGEKADIKPDATPTVRETPRYLLSCFDTNTNLLVYTKLFLNSLQLPNQLTFIYHPIPLELLGC
jgi:hypothetical protein